MAHTRGTWLATLILFAYWSHPVASVIICDVCTCQDMEPYFIDCSTKNLETLFIDEDWQETLTSKNISERDLNVRFDYNKINTVKRFPELRIVTLSLTYNTIDFIEDSAFADLKRLKSLDLSHNNLNRKSLPELSFFGKKNDSHYFPLPVEFLAMSHNNIHGLDKNLFDHLPSLKTLDMSGNPLKVLGTGTTQALVELKNLTVLDLANTSISTLPAGLLHDMIHLETLVLANNKFTEPPEELKNSHNLTVLVLNGNKFHMLTAESFPESLTTLTRLEISNMPTLKEIDVGTFGHMKNLREFYCHHNRKLSKISDGAFSGITEDPQHWPVAEMYLNDNGIHVLHKAMASWEYVDVLDVQNNPFKCDCHIQWMVETLIPEIQQGNKGKYALDVLCREPESLRGVSLLGLSMEHEVFIKCPKGQLLLNVDGELPVPAYPIQAVGVVILAIGVVLIVIGLSILTVLIVKRRAIANALMQHHQIRYERAEQDEEDLQPYGNNRKF